MGKSSSSSKKIKRSKDSSKLRSVKTKKTKRNKSKKIRRIKDYSDESESGGSDSSLYSSSEDDYRREKRKSKVSKKKRSRKRYSSGESDDDTRLLKKKKRSKRGDKHVSRKKKKLGSRKRRKRDLSPSSTSSESCSTRDNKSDDGSESDGRRRTKDKGKLGKVKAKRRSSKDDSEDDSEPDDSRQVEDEVMTEKNSRRLKSIVVVSYAYGNDDRKEDMVGEHDVYLTRRGNRELGHNEESDEIDGGTTISYPRNDADDSGRKTVGYDGFEQNNKSETSKASHPDNSLKDDYLEAILKKRALENLKRFRGVTQRSAIPEGETEIVELSQDHGLMEQKLSVSAGNRDLETSQKILQVVNVKESGTALAKVKQDQPAGDTAKVKASSGIKSCTTKRKLIRPVLGQENLNLTSRIATGCQDAEAESIHGSTIDKYSPESSVDLATKNGGENIKTTKISSTLNAQSSSHADSETLEEFRGESLSEQKTIDETKDESQYEQKTMTVMRGGELVQVSYKVYIPKKTSSLGRRQLKR